MKNAYYSYRIRKQKKNEPYLSLEEFIKTREEGPFDRRGAYSPDWQRGLGRPKDFWYSGKRKERPARVKMTREELEKLEKNAGVVKKKKTTTKKSAGISAKKTTKKKGVPVKKTTRIAKKGRPSTKKKGTTLTSKKSVKTLGTGKKKGSRQATGKKGRKKKT